MALFNGDLNLVMEDDCSFIDPEAWDVIEMALKELPEDWLCLYLGAMLHTPLKRYSNSLFELRKGWGTHAILYNGMELRDDFISTPIETILRANNIDTYFVYKYQINERCFITNPLLAVQRESFSDIIKKNRNYAMTTNYKKFTEWKE